MDLPEPTANPQASVSSDGTVTMAPANSAPVAGVGDQGQSLPTTVSSEPGSQPIAGLFCDSSAVCAVDATPVPSSQPAAASTPYTKPTDWQDARARERLALCEAYESLIERGRVAGQTISIRAGAAAMGVDHSQFARIWKLWMSSGRDYNALIPQKPHGRQSALQKLGIAPPILEEQQKKIQGISLDVEFEATALRAFAHTEDCHPALAGVLLQERCSKSYFPKSIRNLAYVSEAVRRAHRGPRQSSLGGIWMARTLDILPGDVFETDDTTATWCCWIPWRACEEYPFGCKLMQVQLLPVIDVASQCVVTYALIGREQSSYRACDIWSLFGHTFDTVGLPRLGWRLERGSFESNCVVGLSVKYQDGEPNTKKRVGALRQLPNCLLPWHYQKYGDEVRKLGKTQRVWTSYEPKTKSIEAFFHRSQTLEACLWGSLGRDQMRAPMEKAKKLFQMCSRPGAKEDPRQHFYSMEEIAARLHQIYAYKNEENMEGRVYSGIPRERFDAAVAENPLLPIPGEHKWIYRRDWRPTKIKNGFVRLQHTNPVSGDKFTLAYSNPEIFARHDGQLVLCYYDATHFEQPAQIIHAQSGKYLCQAFHVAERGMFMCADKTGIDLKKRWKSAVMTSYGTLRPYIPSRQMPEEIRARRAEIKTIANVPAEFKTISQNSTPDAPDEAEFERRERLLAEDAETETATETLTTEK